MKVGKLSFHTEERKISKKVLPSSVGVGPADFLAGQVTFKAYLSNGLMGKSSNNLSSNKISN